MKADVSHSHNLNHREHDNFNLELLKRAVAVVEQTGEVTRFCGRLKWFDDIRWPVARKARAKLDNSR